jgi:hypothetical protein
VDPVGRIRLYLRQSPRAAPATVHDARGNAITLPFLRVFTLIRAGIRTSRLLDAIIDSGAPLTVFPLQVWQPFSREIEWLRPAADQGPASWITQLQGRTGGRSACDVGRVFVEALDMERPPRVLRAVPVIAQFERSPHQDDRVIVGLHASILQSRRMIVMPDLSDAWLEDA